MSAPLKFPTLDAIRGLAAIAVLVWHSESLFGWRPASGYLAVDLFFILSGFVLANAYDERLRKGMTPRRFMLKRFVRVYPLYAAGLALAMFWPVVSFVIHAPSAWSPGSLALAAGLEVFFLPAPSPTAAIYPLNSPAWSLLSELVVNAVFAYAFAWLTNARLFWLSVVSFVGVAVSAAFWGDLNIGWNWNNWMGAFPRVFFAFPVGVLLNRAYRSNGWRLRTGAWPPILATVIAVSLEPTARELYDVVVVLLVFPAVVLAAASTDVKRFTRTFSFLGATSYATYCLHIPLYSLYSSGVPAVLRLQLVQPVAGLVFLLGVIAVSYMGECWHRRVAAIMERSIK